MENSIKCGDFLEDVDFTIYIRSGKTDLVVLQKLSNAIVASLKDLVDTEIVLTDTELNVKLTASGKLSTVVRKLQI